MKNILSKVLRYLPNNKRVKSKDVKSLLITLGIYIGIAFVLAIVKTILRNIPLVGNLLYNIGSVYKLYSWVGAIIAAIQCFGNDDYSEVEYITFDEIKNLKSLWESRNVKIAMIVCLAALCLIPNGNKPKTFSSSDEKDSVASADTNEVKEEVEKEESEVLEPEAEVIEEETEVQEMKSDVVEETETETLPQEESFGRDFTECAKELKVLPMYNEIEYLFDDLSSVVLYSFSDTERINREIVYSMSGTVKEINTYDENGNILQRFKYITSGLYETCNYNYDSEGKCIGCDFFDRFGNKSGISYEYDEEGKLIKEISDVSKGNQIIRKDDDFEIFSYEYDEDGNMVRKNRLKDENGDSFFYYWAYEYDEDGNIREKTKYDRPDKIEENYLFGKYYEGIPSSVQYQNKYVSNIKYEAIYDENGNLSRMNRSSKHYVEHEYDNEGRIIKSALYDDDVTTDTNYQYDENGVLNRTTGNDKFGNEIEIIWEYDENGNPISINYYLDGKFYIKQENQYDSTGNIIKNLYYTSENEPAYSVNEFSYDSDGRIVFYSREQKNESTYTINLK